MIEKPLYDQITVDYETVQDSRLLNTVLLPVLDRVKCPAGLKVWFNLLGAYSVNDEITKHERDIALGAAEQVQARFRR